MRLLAIDNCMDSNGLMELTDDRPSAQKFWGHLLDFALEDGASGLKFKPADGEDCILIETRGETLPMVPPPDEARSLFLRVGHELALGRMRYLFYYRPMMALFGREEIGRLQVEVGSRRSTWKVRCCRDSIRFTPVAETESTRT